VGWENERMEGQENGEIQGLRDCGMERKTKGWRDKRMEKYRDIGVEGLRDRRKDN
jgi:hypothetical protein